MVKWWLGVALGVCGLAGNAAAQYPYVPNQGQAAPLPEPVPLATMPPATAPAPGGPGMAGPLPGPGHFPTVVAFDVGSLTHDSSRSDNYQSQGAL